MGDPAWVGDFADNRIRRRQVYSSYWTARTIHSVNSRYTSRGQGAIGSAIRHTRSRWIERPELFRIQG